MYIYIYIYIYPPTRFPISGARTHINASCRPYDFFDPSSGMLGFEVKNLLESAPQNRDSLDDGSRSKNAQVHPYQGCLGSRCKTS